MFLVVQDTIRPKVIYISCRLRRNLQHPNKFIAIDGFNSNTSHSRTTARTLATLCGRMKIRRQLSITVGQAMNRYFIQTRFMDFTIQSCKPGNCNSYFHNLKSRLHSFYSKCEASWHHWVSLDMLNCCLRISKLGTLIQLHDLSLVILPLHTAIIQISKRATADPKKPRHRRSDYHIEYQTLKNRSPFRL